MQGEIQNLPLPDLIQWLAYTRRTGKLIITQSPQRETQPLTAAGPSVELYFAKGELALAARTGGSLSVSVEKARALLGSALAWRSGQFIFNAAPLLPLWVSAVNLHLSAETLLQEAVRELNQYPQPAAALMPAKLGQAGRRSEIFRHTNSLRLEVVDRMLREDFNIPAMPQLAARVLELMLDENFSLRELGNLILTDQAVAARILRYANSAMSGAARSVDSLAQAVQRLGAQEVINIVFAAALLSQRLGTGPFASHKRRLWAHASVAAFVARALAARVGLDSNLGFLGGLLMDFGANVLYSLIQDTLVRNTSSAHIPTQLVEDLIEDYHPRVGRLVGEKWRLPETIIGVMTYHHRLEDAPSDKSFVAVAAFADFFTDIILSVPRAELEELLASLPLETVAAHPAAQFLKLDESRAAALLAELPRCVDIALEFGA